MGGAGLTSAGACLVLEVHAKRLYREDVLLNISENLNQTRIMEKKRSGSFERRKIHPRTRPNIQ